MSLTRKAQLLPVPCGSLRCLWLLIDCMRGASAGLPVFVHHAQSGAAPALLPAMPITVRHSSPQGSKRELERRRAGTFCRCSCQPRSKERPTGMECAVPSSGLACVCPGVHQQLGRPEELHRLPLAWLEPRCKRKIHW